MSEISQPVQQGTEFTTGDVLDFTKPSPRLESLAVVRAAREAYEAAAAHETAGDNHEVLPSPLYNFNKIGIDLDATRREYLDAA